MTMLEYDHARFIRYGGHNPEFYERVRAKQLRDEAESVARREAEKRVASKRRRELFEKAMESTQDIKSYRCIDVISTGDRVSTKEIIAHVAAIYCIPVSEILGQRRNRPVVSARFAAMKAVADRRPDLSLPQIGKIFGRDHTTVLHAINKLGGRAKQGGSHV